MQERAEERRGRGEPLKSHDNDDDNKRTQAFAGEPDGRCYTELLAWPATPNEISLVVVVWVENRPINFDFHSSKGARNVPAGVVNWRIMDGDPREDKKQVIKVAGDSLTEITNGGVGKKTNYNENG